MNHHIKYERWTFPADKIREGNIYLATSLLASSLEVNNFYAVVECEDPAILNFRRNTKLMYYASPDRPMIFRVQKVERIGPKLYKLTATSTLGLLTEGLHYGGIYHGQTLIAMLRDICGKVPFTVKGSIAHIKLYGWLPIAAPRDNLAQALFAVGATLKTDLDGVLRIEPLWDGVSWYTDEDHVSDEGTVPYDAPVTSVVVTEHQYIEDTETRTLFDGTSASGDIITFNEPMHNLSAVGFYILGSGANWAKLSAGTGTLTGQPYIHNTREVTQVVTEAYEPNIKRVTDATLVSLVNSKAVANRLARFYRMRETIDAPVIYQGEQPGDCMSVCHPFDRKQTVSCLQSADITLSNTLMAKEKSLVGFLPERPEQVEIYNSREILTGDGEWECPPDVHFIDGVLIGGGDGGWSGLAGAKGTDGKSNSKTSNPGGAGGQPGLGGSAGKVLRFSMSVDPGTKYQYHAGPGGVGGKYSSAGTVAGSYGGASTFGEYSSDAGAASPNGYVDAVTLEKYAVPGESGQAGADGGKSGYTEPPRDNGFEFPASSASGGDAIDFESGSVYKGGEDARSHSYHQMIYNDHGIFVKYIFEGFSAGGGAGGAAVGSNGADGEAGDRYYAGFGGTGGAATITPRKASVPGMGGTGGNGGGGGGAGGSAYGKTGNSISALPRTGGAGGRGSAGGTGGDGIIILYYGKSKKIQSGQFMDRQGRRVLDRLSRRFIV